LISIKPGRQLAKDRTLPAQSRRAMSHSIGR
jgi:hypothetical protein